MATTIAACCPWTPSTWSAVGLTSADRKPALPGGCPLWPETVQAIREAIAARPEPKTEAAAGLVFVTKYGGSWARDNDPGVLTKEMRKLLDSLDINGSRNFYTLRHTFRT